MRYDVFGTTDRGRRRETNEDAYLVREDLGLFAVADGLGGHAAGEVASAMAIEILATAIAAAAPGITTAADLETALEAAVERAHHAIAERAKREPEKSGMGTTLTALAFVPGEDGEFRIANVGDSRAYLLRDGTLRQLTTDHTFVQDQVARGRLTREQARTHPLSTVLTRALGIPGDELRPDLIAGRLAPGDLVLLCTDGLTGMVDDEDLRAMLDREIPLDRLADELVEAANLRGGADNITVVLIRAAA